MASPTVTTATRLARVLRRGVHTSGECVRVALDGFRIDETRGISRALPGADALDADVLAEVAFNCPTRAIRVTEHAA